MFTLPVSWLLVACVPGLLMLAALGLGRLESELGHQTVTTTDVDDFLERADPLDVHTLAREGMPEALEYLHRRQAQGLSGPPSIGRHAGPRHAAPSFAPTSPTMARSVCRPASTATRAPIRNLAHLNMSTVCSVGTLDTLVDL